MQQYDSITPCSIDKTKWIPDELEKDTYFPLRGPPSSRGDTYRQKFEYQAYSSEECCKIFRSSFNFENIAAFLDIMKFSMGLSLPLPITEMKSMEFNEYRKLLPSHGNFKELDSNG